jgi:formylglycine-generating enzyme
VSDLVWIPAQTATLGSDDHYREEAPAREVTVDGFWIQPHQVTNEQFAEFVTATRYVTVAERPLNPADYPGAPPENLQPGSMVFGRTPGPVDLRHLNQWWTWMPGACWNHPRGPRSSLRNRDDHPVVHIAFEDAAAYANWVHLELPSEAEWEIAARGGLPHTAYTWGEDPEGPGDKLANYWHGEFPYLPDTDRRHRWVALRPTATGFSTWRAMSGNGPPIGTAIPATSNHVVLQIVTTYPNLSSRSRAK